MSRPTSPFSEDDSIPFAKDISKYKTKDLINFLRNVESELELLQKDFDLIEQERINGHDFLKSSREDFEHYGFNKGPARRLVEFAKMCNEKKKKAFSSYKSLDEVLKKYGISSNRITSIPQFKPATHPIDENSAEFKHCIDDILLRIKNMGPVVDCNEAMRCEYISTILHTAVSLLGGLVLESQIAVSGEDSTGRVDFGIKKIISRFIEEIICITEGKINIPGIGFAQNLNQCRNSCDANLNTFKQNNKRKADEAFDPEYEYVYGIVTTATEWWFILHSTEGIYCTSMTEYRIPLTLDVLKDQTELRKSVKRVLEVIVGLLKDRMDASDKPESKKQRVSEQISVSEIKE